MRGGPLGRKPYEDRKNYVRHDINKYRSSHRYPTPDQANGKVASDLDDKKTLIWELPVAEKAVQTDSFEMKSVSYYQ